MTLETTTRSLAEVKAYLDELLHVAGLDEEGNGLVVGGRPSITKVGLAVNCSFQAIDRALARGCDLLITHHGAWRKTDGPLAAEKIGRLSQHGINLYVAHDCLDNARDFGMADSLARAVRVTIAAPFKPDDESEFGVHGVTAGHFSEFVVRTGNQLGVEPRSWKNSDSFGHVAIISGWGARAEWMARAQALGCDTVLSGEGNMFGILFAREAGLNLVLAGHYETETPGMLALTARIARGLQLDVTFIPEDVIA